VSRTILAAPISGWLTSTRDVPDPVFSEEMMGVGVAIDPAEGTLVAPCDAEVLLVAPAKHSVTLKTAQGAELLIHIGLETVALEGRGFETHVGGGERVSLGDPLISFDLDEVGLEAKSLVTPILLTNAHEFRFIAEPLDRLVERGSPIAWIERSGGAAKAETQAGDGLKTQAMIGFAHGLHARPAGRIADLAKRFSSEIILSAGDKSASARSPTAIMALGAIKGTRVQLSALGDDSKGALEAIVELLERGEEDQRPEPRLAAPRALAKNEIAGVCALPGIALGTAVHWRRKVGETSDEGRGAEEERAALSEARALVRVSLEAFIEQGGAAGDIARAHIGLLEDEELNRSADKEIERGTGAARAWQLATSAAAEALRKADSPLLRERVADLDDIAAQVIAGLLGDAPASTVELPESTILIADNLLPSEIMSLPRGRLAGLATAGGGPTSHMAIIAASFGIPTLVAMGPEISRIPDGTSLLLDAAGGVLVIDPDERARERALALVQVPDQGGECTTRDGKRVTLLANLGGLSDVKAALAAGAEGCGLLRTEFLFLDRANAPSEKEQHTSYQAIADALEGRPLTIRTLDIGGDKPVSYIRFPSEQNPALGARGIRTELLEPELLNEQLRAIAGVKGDAVKIMIPMVSSVAELRNVREKLGSLRENVTLGIMVETPAAALIADRFAAEADFLSIGSNDLAQYALAMDRTNPLLAASIDALHPAVLRLMAMTSEAGARAGKTVSVCGNLASDPLGALVLIGLGIRELSGVPAALAPVRQAIAQVSASDCQRLAAQALDLESASEVRALAAELLGAGAQGELR
jgi:phosphocarrier protein FPr/phosphocarrier protein